MEDVYYSKNTIGCKVGSKIFVHPDLPKHPLLYRAIINHERKHTNKVSAKDIKMDLFNDELKGVKKDYYKFILSHPRTLLGFLPLTKVGKTWAFDLQLTIVWIVFIAFGFYIGSTL